jgi:adenylate cyclase
MKIRAKVLMVVLPLFVFPLLLVGIISYSSARSGITRVAKEFLSYKATELFKFCSRQESILEDTGLADSANYRETAKESAEAYADSIRLSETGYFIVLNSGGDTVFPEGEEKNLSTHDFFETMTENKRGLINFSYRNQSRIGYFLYFEPWDWYILLSEQEKVFYQDADNIKKQVAYILGIALVIAVGLILFFIKKLTDPIGNVVQAMQQIITNNDLSNRVRVEYDDEVGYLATWFNRMIGDLEVAYNQIKEYAYKSVLAKKSEERIRHIFQKYVPAEIIDEVLKSKGDSLLVGKKTHATILFSDIRSFTSISERLTAEELVNSLNTYFNIMVTIIIEHKGIIDKFIGDAIMAIFGAPVLHEDDPLQAVLTGLSMLESLKTFNRKQTLAGKPPFRIGIGLNTGDVVVGNIGSTQKLDYTCIGDTVNLASRLEGLTKLYGTSIIISEFTYKETRGGVLAREIDSVRVKGRAEPVKIYEPYMEATRMQKEAYQIFNDAIHLYRNRKFEDSLRMFRRTSDLLGQDTPSSLYIERCEELLQSPPGEEWDGVFTAKTK